MGKFKCATVSGYGLNFRPMLSARKSGSRTSGEAGQELQQFFHTSLGESSRFEEAGGEEAY